MNRVKLWRSVMNAKKRVTIIGHFGGKKNYCDGQTVKTKTVCSSLILNDHFKVEILDTYYARMVSNFWIKLLWNIIFSDCLIFLLASNGRKYLFPIMYFVSLFGKITINYTIGGKLYEEALKKKKYKKYIAGFTENWVESFYLLNNLKKIGINNVVYVPNFKKINPLSVKEVLQEQCKRPFRLCIFSRVCKEKGIEEAMAAVTEINRECGKLVCQLHIYGPVAREFQDRFASDLKLSPEVFYMGVVPPEQSVHVIKGYYALLFPTQTFTEGMPGTIIDAFCAGVPVIARAWASCDEMIIDGETGYTYSFDKPQLLKSRIIDALKDQSWSKMRKNCLKKASEYDEKLVCDMIVGRIEKILHI